MIEPHEPTPAEWHLATVMQRELDRVGSMARIHGVIVGIVTSILVGVLAWNAPNGWHLMHLTGIAVVPLVLVVSMYHIVVMGLQRFYSSREYEVYLTIPGLPVPLLPAWLRKHLTFAADVLTTASVSAVILSFIVGTLVSVSRSNTVAGGEVFCCGVIYLILLMGYRKLIEGLMCVAIWMGSGIDYRTCSMLTSYRPGEITLDDGHWELLAGGVDRGRRIVALLLIVVERMTLVFLAVISCATMAILGVPFESLALRILLFLLPLLWAPFAIYPHSAWPICEHPTRPEAKVLRAIGLLPKDWAP